MVYLAQQALQAALVLPVKPDHQGQLVNQDLVELPGKQALPDILVKMGLPGPLAAVDQPDKLVKPGQLAQRDHQVIQDLQVFLVRVVFLV